MTDHTAIESVLERSAFGTLFTSELAARTRMEPAELERDLGRLAEEGVVVLGQRAIHDHGTSVVLKSVTIIDRGSSRTQAGPSERHVSAWDRNEAHWMSFNSDFIAHHRCC